MRYRQSSSALTGRFPRSLSSAFGCSMNDPVHPMQEPSLWHRFLTWLTGQPDNLETTK